VNLKGEAAKLLEPGAVPQPAPAAPATAAAPVAAAAGGDEWSEEQELALVKALKAVGKDVEDRWGQVAALVPGKGKAECFKKFKAMKEAHRSAKKG
jgi:DnaJ family protein C protein 2